MIQSPLYWAVVFGSALVFWLLPAGIRFGFLAAVSTAYMASIAPWWNVAALAAWTLAFHRLAPLTAESKPMAARILAAMILGIASYLAYFKYLPPILSGLTSDRFELQVVIPLGISYFTFKLIHYAVEVSRGTIRDRSLQQFFCYIFLFPIFTAGPIERYDHFLAQQSARFTIDDLVEGGTRIVHGLIKKFVFAGLILKPILGERDTGAELLSVLEVWPSYKVWGFMILSYAIMYLDFSAYSDIAIGTSRLFGIRIMENFNFPIFANNLGNYWKRWHISLSSWCQTYVYLPVLGLSRNPYLATCASFLVMGLWHSGSWMRVCWGLYQALGVAAYVTWSQYKRKKKIRFLDKGLWRFAGIPLTLAYVIPSLAFLVVEFDGRVYDAFRILARLAFFHLPA